MEMKMLKLLMTAACLILAALLASPVTAKDYFSMKDYAAGLAPEVSVSVADASGTAVDDGRMWLAIKTIQCGSRRLVVWRELNNVSDYYATREQRVRKTFPRVTGKFTYDDTSGETSLNGRPCQDAE
jgi:hypothetical protein